jgi:hypothetical protein
VAAAIVSARRSRGRALFSPLPERPRQLVLQRLDEGGEDGAALGLDHRLYMTEPSRASSSGVMAMLTL